MIWRKGSGCESNNCMEVRVLRHKVLVRNSSDPVSPVLIFSRDSWKAFIEGARRGEFDLENAMPAKRSKWTSARIMAWTALVVATTGLLAAIGGLVAQIIQR